MKLYAVVHLPEWEDIPSDDDEAIDYMSQWDYGEYVPDDDTTLEELRELSGTVYLRGEYVLYRELCGDAYLYVTE